jgi:hypothetical protein
VITRRRPHERTALGLLAWPELAALGPPRELAVRGELQRQDLVASEATRQHGRCRFRREAELWP